MKFVLRQAVLDGTDETLDRVDRIVDRVADEVHVIEVPDADLLEESNWYATARQTRRKLVKTAVAAPVRASSLPGSPHTKAMTVGSGTDAELADKLAHTPLILLVENRESDGVLLEILIEECGSPSLIKFWAASQRCTPRAVELDTAGGVGEMPARISRAAKEAEDEGRPIRMVVVCDSDARWPYDQSQHVAKVSTACTTAGVPLHVLSKRYAESYIPDEVVLAVRSDPRSTAHAHRFDALLRRSATQRDHFPIREGLSADERTEGTNRGQYSARDAADLDLLSTRLFPKRPRLMQQLNEQHRPSFTCTGLLARDGNGEIEALLNLIASEV